MDNILTLAVIIVLGYLFLISLCINVLLPFFHEVRGIKLEIERSDGEEEAFWRKELRLLYIRSIPLIGRLFRK